MNKVFLCHSSVDKEYIQIVASHLRRANIIFDEVSFEPGSDFRIQINKGLNASSLFVFFASRNSLNSNWCKYEMNIAELLKIQGNFSSMITIIIDDYTTDKDLPKWMQSSKAIFQKKPSQAIRDIKELLLTTSSSCNVKPFVGRQELQQEFVDIISNWSSAPKRIIMITGLEGIGRRSHLERVSKDTIDLNLGPYFIMNETDGIEDIYFWLYDETYDMNMKRNRIEELSIFSKLNLEQKIIETSSRLHILCGDDCIPCFIDEGGMLDEQAKLKDNYRMLLEVFLKSDCDHYLAFIFSRVPQIRELSFFDNILYQKVGPLNQNESKLLLKLLFKRNGNEIEQSAINEIVDYIDGYPPCAYYAAWYSHLYGLGNILSDKSYLEDFKARRFTRYIKNLNLSEKQWRLLQYLSNEDFVPLSLLSIVLDINQNEMTPILCNLIDNNLVRVLNDNFGISNPIKSAIVRSKGVLETSDYTEIKEKIINTFWSSDTSTLTLEIIDATLHAVARSGSRNFDPYDGLVRISTIHTLALEYYHSRKWEDALEYSKRALQIGFERQDIRVIYFKSLVQLERWDEAAKELSLIEDSGNRNSSYLKGFMLRKRNKYVEAIKCFEAALQSGNLGYNVYRDYAECLHRCGRNKEALRAIKKVIKHDSEDIFVLDLALRICIDGQLYDSVEKYLATLEKFDFQKRFIYHRKASYFEAKEMYNAGLIHADAACKTEFASFEAHAIKADIFIKQKQCENAEFEIKQIKESFGNTKKDIQCGLHCKLLLCRGNWQESKSVWDSIDDKTSTVNQRLLQEILVTKSQDMSLSLLERNSAGKEAELLLEVLKKSPISNFSFDEAYLPDD